MRSPAAGHGRAKSQKAQGTKEQPESTLRARIEQAITVLIDALDYLDGDPDCEPTLGRTEVKWATRYPDGAFLEGFHLDQTEPQGVTDDRELDDADHPEGEGDTSDFEPDRDGEGEPERESQWRVPDNAGVPAG